MADVIVVNKLSKRQRRCTLGTIGLLSLFGGVEYAVILPTLYLHLTKTYNAPGFYLGLVISAFSFSGLFASPVAGRFYDKTRRSKLLISLTNVFEFAGSIMYWIGLSPLFLIFSRLVAGLGNGYFPVVLAEISHGTSNEARTSIISAVMAMRQVGLLVGPGFNLFLTKLNFYIGPFIVDQYSSPGLLLALLWLLAEILVVFLYYPLTTRIPASQVESSSSSKATESETPPTNGIQTPPTNGIQTSPTNGIQPINEQYSLSNGHHTVANGHHTVANGHHTVANGTAVYGADLEADKESKETSIQPPNTEDTQAIESKHTVEHRSIKQVILDITYHEYMAIYMLTLVSLFNQCAMETMFTPLCTKYFGWTEEQISLLFCGAGVLILISFFMVHLCSKRFLDRTLIIFGSVCQVITLAWCLYWVPTFKAEGPKDYLNNTLILVPALVLNVFGLPFLFVCHISLFSKLLKPDIQGTGHGIRRIVGGIASILGPNWASSLLEHHYIMFGVMLGLNVLALILIMLSYNKLYVPIKEPSLTHHVDDNSDEEEVNERTRLINS